MDSLEFQPADVNDAEALTGVYHSAYQENRQLGFPAKAGSITPETVEEWIEANEVYVAKIEDEIVGGVRLTKTDPGRIKLSRLAVHDDWKDRGIGSALLGHVEEKVKNQGNVTIWLTTPEDHPYLPEFYRSRGYEKSGKYPLENRDYDEIILEKRV